MRKVLHLISCLVLFSVVCLSSGQTPDFRLPRSLIPTHYALQLQPILDETPGYTRFSAPGTVTITVNCADETDTIKLHALDLVIVENATKVTTLSGGENVNILEQSTEPELHFFVIKLGETLKTGSQYNIFLQFITPVSQTRLDGMYLDQYVDPETNQTKYVATTLFAAISARRCYPSFDEPHLKAIFTISLARKDAYHSLSNMHQVSTEPLPGMDGWHLDKFAPSLPMSTYLVAMIVSDMTFEQAVPPSSAANNATIRVYAPYYFINRGGGIYAANQTKTVLAKFDEYFDSTFMLQKLDSVSLPRFFFSAMENWALITYNDRVLLYFPGESTEQERYRITSIISHEVGHHYFGNMVTCEWWTWIWLNEGSATYFSHLGVEMTYPEFNPWDRFINDVYQVAMEYDSTPNTHPVANEPKSLADIGGIYDDIAYEKGASLIRMMRSFLSEELMQRGIRRYIKENQFKNVRQDDLFRIMQDVAEESNYAQPATIKEIMDTWTMQEGFPLVRVSRVNCSSVRLTQEKFELGRKSSGKSEEKWWIPVQISVITPSPKDYFFWISNDKDEKIFNIPEEEIFVVNSRSEGYYRTLYSPDLLKDLLDSLKIHDNACLLNQDKFSPKAKAKILDDYVAFIKANLSSSETLHEIVDSFCLENENMMVWETLLKHYTRQLLETYRTKNITSAEKVKAFMKEMLLDKMKFALDRLESLPNSQIGENMMLRSELTFWNCLLQPNQPRCLDFTNQRLEEWTFRTSDDSNEIKSPFEPDFEDTYFCVAARESDANWRTAYNFSLTKKSMPCAYARMLSALVCATNKTSFELIYPDFRKEFKEFSEANGIPKIRIFAENLPVIRAAIRILFNEPVRQVLWSENKLN